MKRINILLFAMLASTIAQSSEVHVLAPSAVRSAIAPIIERFQADTANTVVMHYGGTGLLLGQLADGSRADVLILPFDATDDLRQRGQLAAPASVRIGEVGIGVAVAQDAPPVDVSTPEAMKRVLLGARGIAAIAPGNSTSGKHFAEVVDQLGITGTVASKLVLVHQGYAAERIVQGQADVAVQQITEILPVRGVRLAGPLPPELQKTTLYLGSVYGRAKEPDAGADFLRALASPDARAGFASHGFSTSQ